MRCFGCDRLTNQLASSADEMGFWRYQAEWHRAWILAGGKAPTDAQMDRARQELEAARVAENAELCAHAEAPRDPGGT